MLSAHYYIDFLVLLSLGVAHYTISLHCTLQHELNTCYQGRSSAKASNSYLRLFEYVFDAVDDVKICCGGRAVWIFVKEAHAVVCTLAYPRIQRNRTKESNTHLLCETLGSTGGWLEDLAFRFAVATYEARHVLHEPEYRYADFTTKVDLAPHVLECYLLRRGDEYGTIDAGLPNQRLLGIGRSGRSFWDPAT